MWGFFRRRSGTPYDDVFKTMLVKGSRLVIPLINEMFHLKEPISMDEDVKLESNEHFLIWRAESRRKGSPIRQSRSAAGTII